MVQKSEKYQYYAAFCVNLMTVSYGAICGWPSPSFLVLQSPEETPLENGPMTNEEASWVGSILCIGGLVGNFLFGWMANKFGGKISMISLSLPLIMSWLFIIFAKNVMHLCISRFLGGLAGGGTFALVPLYITDISEDKIRGSLGSYLVLSCNVGILIEFVLGNYVPYDFIPYILLVLPVIFVLTLSFLPETPQHLLRIKKIKEAEKALRYFRNVRRISEEPPEKFKAEMEKLKNEHLDQTNLKSDTETSTPLTWNDFNNRIARKALFIGIALMALNQFCGCFAMINYTASIFKQSGSNLSPNMSAIIVGVIQLLGAYVSTMLVERAGRKILLSVSSIGTGIGFICLGLYTYFNYLKYDLSGLNWIPVASFSFIIFLASCGILTLPFLVISEIMPPKIRSIGCVICMSLLWIFAFLMIKYLTLFIEVFEMHGTMFIFAFCCFSGAIFVMIFIPETKGKSIETILTLL